MIIQCAQNATVRMFLGQAHGTLTRCRSIIRSKFVRFVLAGLAPNVGNAGHPRKAFARVAGLGVACLLVMLVGRGLFLFEATHLNLPLGLASCDHLIICSYVL